MLRRREECEGGGGVGSMYARWIFVLHDTLGKLSLAKALVGVIQKPWQYVNNDRASLSLSRARQETRTSASASPWLPVQDFHPRRGWEEGCVAQGSRYMRVMRARFKRVVRLRSGARGW